MKKNYLLKVMALLMTLLLMCMPMKTFAAEEEEKSETEYSQTRSNPDFENFGGFDYILPQTENNFHKYILEIETPTGYGSGSYRLQEHYYDVDASYVQVLRLLWIQVYDAISWLMFMVQTNGIRNIIYMSKETRHTIYMVREYSEHPILYGQRREEIFMLLMMRARDILNWLARSIIK